ncbi:5-carboxymethyl-2-hydroxymuconate Delta-isomerase, partial [Shewanella sp. 0m-11]
MPHCTIEYSAPLAEVLSIDALVAASHRGLTESELFEPKAIKTRAYACDYFQ